VSDPVKTPSDDADSGDKKTEDAESLALELELLKSKRRTEILEQRLARFKSLVPGSSSKGREGLVTVESGAGYLTEWVARSTVRALARRIAKNASSGLTADDRVLIVDSPKLIEADWRRKLIQARLGQIKADLEAREGQLAGALALVKVVEQPVQDPARTSESGGAANVEGARRVVDALHMGTPSADTAGEGSGTDAPAAPATAVASGLSTAGSIAALLGGAADVLSMVRTDYQVSKRDVQLTSASLAAEIVARLRESQPCTKFILETFSLLGESAVLDELEEVMTLRNALAQSADALRGFVGDDRLLPLYVERLAQAIKARDALSTAAPATEKANARVAVEKAEDDITLANANERPAVRQARSVLDGSVSQIVAVDAEIRAFLETPAEGGLPPIISAGIIARLKVPFKREPTFTHVLYVGVDNSGGEIVTRKGLFQPSGRVNYLGGAAGTWVLIKVDDSTITASGTEAEAMSLAYDLRRNSGTLVSVDRTVVDNGFKRFVRAVWRNLLGPFVKILAVALVLTVIVGFLLFLLAWVPWIVAVVQELIAQVTPAPLPT